MIFINYKYFHPVVIFHMYYQELYHVTHYIIVLYRGNFGGRKIWQILSILTNYAAKLEHNSLF